MSVLCIFVCCLSAIQHSDCEFDALHEVMLILCLVVIGLFRLNPDASVLVFHLVTLIFFAGGDDFFNSEFTGSQFAPITDNSMHALF